MNALDPLLVHPAVQAFAVPLAVALLVAGLLRHRLPAGALAVAAGLLAAAALTIGLSFTTLTATRRMVLVVLGAALLFTAFDERLGRAGRARVWAPALTAGLAALWVLERLLLQLPPTQAAAAGAGSAAFLALLVGSVQAMRRNAASATLAGAALAAGAGLLAVLGASAILGQLGIAVAAGAGAVLLLLLLRAAPARPDAGAATAALGAGLVALLAVFTGQLPWPAVLPLLAVPWAQRLVPAARPAAAWQRGALLLVATVLPVLLALAAAWAAPT